MGTNHQSIIGWGFYIPERKLPALLAALKKQPPPSDSAQLQSESERAELKSLIQAVMDTNEYSEFFHFMMADVSDWEYTGVPALLRLVNYEGGGRTRGYTVSRWGRENYGDTLSPLPDLDREHIMELVSKDGKKFVKLQEDLHLADAGIKVAEEWMQCVSIT